jgi:hypothetical protein
MIVRYGVSSRFSPEDREFIARTVEDRRLGWSPVFGAKFVRSLDRGAMDVFITTRPASEIASDSPTVAGLSYTRMDVRPRVIFMNESNWSEVPAGSYYGDLEAYRTYLVNHEMGHAAFSLGHRNEPRREFRCASIMGQQTRQREWDPDGVLRVNPFPVYSPETRGVCEWTRH